MARYSLGQGKNFFVNAGPYLGILLKHEQVYDAVNQLPEAKVDGTDDVQRIDYGFSVGLGGQVNLQDNLKLSLELRNNLGLYNVTKTPEVIIGGDAITNSTNILLGLSYLLN